MILHLKKQIMHTSRKKMYNFQKEGTQIINTKQHSSLGVGTYIDIKHNNFSCTNRILSHMQEQNVTLQRKLKCYPFILKKNQNEVPSYDASMN